MRALLLLADVSSPPALAGATRTDAPEGEPAQTGTRRRPRVLIADGQRESREMFAWCLLAAGWSVEAVTDGADALIVAPVFMPDVFVMDLQLRSPDAVEMIRCMKRHDRTKHIPIVAISRMDHGLTEAEAWVAGCEEVVSRETGADHLRAVVELLVVRTDGDLGDRRSKAMVARAR